MLNCIPSTQSETLLFLNINDFSATVLQLVKSGLGLGSFVLNINNNYLLDE